MPNYHFQKKNTGKAYNFYDSLRLDEPSLKNIEALTARKELLGNLANPIETIETQDSLQKIAGLPEQERKDFVKKLVKKFRKAQGLKDESATTAIAGNPIQPPPNLFAPPEKKGEWYFYNTASRTRGQSEFRSKWGNRANLDDWRRDPVSNAGQGNQNRGVTGRDGQPSQILVCRWPVRDHLRCSL